MPQDATRSATTERARIRWLALLLILAVLGLLGWYFDLFVRGPVVVSTVVL
jgi:hypothetical protein